METYQEIIHTLSLTLGASWASGINLYAALAVLGFAGASGMAQLPPGLEILTNPMVIGAACTMYVVEFFADKIPGVDTTWDSLHTFIRIPAGAMLAAGAVGDVGPGLEIAAAILGGGLATASHVTKAGGRVVINASPEPFTNWTASIVEDVVVIGGMWAALQHPWIFFTLLALFIIFVIWILPKIGRGIAKVFRFIGRLFGVQSDPDISPEDFPDTTS
ncbi:MAG: DUF4126 domain-containing protein, partial [Deltaproteobacteria bacterium]|nr:DUF4126 domain-containing protein [Deltaproteobacteria bacterium]